MPLPETPRELYQSNPLAEVVAQLRYPTILRIDAELPVQFQDAIRGSFPNYQHIAAAGNFPPGIPPPIRNLFQGMGGAGGVSQHRFETLDQKWTVTLTRDVLSLKTTAYRRWEEYRDQLGYVRAALERIYRPNSYSRISLRYVDIIRRSILRLTDVPWSELLNPAIAGELATAELGGNVESMSRQLHCRLDGENRFLTLKSGIATPKPGTQDTEQCFLIDSDFHTHSATEMANVNDTLEAFNRYSGNLFRWSIEPRLREHLAPVPIAG